MKVFEPTVKVRPSIWLTPESRVDAPKELNSFIAYFNRRNDLLGKPIVSLESDTAEIRRLMEDQGNQEFWSENYVRSSYVWEESTYWYRAMDQLEEFEKANAKTVSA